MPVGAVVGVEAPVLGHDEGLAQQRRDGVEGGNVVQVPVVLVGHRQGDAAPVAHLHPADVVRIGNEALRQRSQADEGGGGEEDEQPEQDGYGDTQALHETFRLSDGFDHPPTPSMK